MSKESSTIAASSEEVYYRGQYWNDFPYVVGEINKRTTGNKDKIWYEHFHEQVGKKRFQKALMVNCGNGWLERKMYELGIFNELVGIDFSDKLLEEAREESDGLPFRYYQLDTNRANFPEEGYDLVINLAAVHHIANLDKVFRNLAQKMQPGGKFVSFDYVGPHRNQYPFDQWAAAWDVNLLLPAKFQQDMKYPHLPTMLVTDPSEAIHSELTHEIMQRYFDYAYHGRAGGAIAYLLLTHNDKIGKASPQDLKKWLPFIMTKDAQYMEQGGGSMFDYWIATPKQKMPSRQELEKFEREEIDREKWAAKNGGVYYQPSLIQHLYLTQEENRIKILHTEAYLNDVLKINSPRSAIKNYIKGKVPQKAKQIYRRIKTK